MLLIAAAAIASLMPQDGLKPHPRPIVQARATVRIVSGARVRWDAADPSVPPLRVTDVQTAEGRRPARLIEFE